MIIEMRTYQIKPTRVLDYLQIYSDNGLELQREILGSMIGFFYTDIGPLNQVVSLWGYESLDDRARRRATLAATPDWQEYVTTVRDLFEAQESRILHCARFSPIR